MLKFNNFTKKYGNLTVFENFNLELSLNKTTAIMGASGVGKTTLLNALAGISEYQGEILKPDSISYVFQTPRLLEHLTVFENLEFVLKNTGISKQEYQNEILKFLNLAGMQNKVNSLASELSGGQKQRVSLIRAFLYPAKLLLMDEPFNSLDLSLKIRIIDLYRDLLSEKPRTVVFVSHDIDEVLSVADEVIVLANNSVKQKIQISSNSRIRDLSEPNLMNARKIIYSAIIS